MFVRTRKTNKGRSKVLVLPAASRRGARRCAAGGHSDARYFRGKMSNLLNVFPTLSSFNVSNFSTSILGFGFAKNFDASLIPVVCPIYSRWIASESFLSTLRAVRASSRRIPRPRPHAPTGSEGPLLRGGLFEYRDLGSVALKGSVENLPAAGDGPWSRGEQARGAAGDDPRPRRDRIATALQMSDSVCG